LAHTCHVSAGLSADNPGMATRPRQRSRPDPRLVQNWTLSTQTLNGVLIRDELPTQSSRSLLHDIGQKHGLIPFCPDDVIDLKLSKDYTLEGVIVISRHGEFMIDKNQG
jgi:hypothetical protein